MRKANGFKPVDLVFVDMIMTKTQDEESNDENQPIYSNKMSSTIVRKFLAKTKEEAENQVNAALYCKERRDD